MLEAMFTRIENAHEGFTETLMHWGGISKADALKVKSFYLKNKIAKLDTGIGRISVKHGVYLEKSVIKDAVTMAWKEAAK